MLCTPQFWQARGPLARLLKPLGDLYARASLRRIHQPPRFRAPVPVICVGNAVAGGAGKTPVTIELARHLVAMGRQPHILSRGYGGKGVSRMPLRVNGQPALEVGDEPLLLAQAAPTWVGHDRTRTAQAALAAGADVLLMDDGYQNPALHKDAHLLVVDSTYGYGNRYCLPAGPLREPVESALRRADGVVLLGDGAADNLGFHLSRDFASSFFQGRIEPSAEHAAYWKGRRVVAFAGIGRPEKFFATLETIGADIVERYAFADHRPYHPREIAALRARAEAQGATLVTTEKDWVRLGGGVDCLPVRCVWRDEAALRDWLEARLAIR